LAIKGTVSAFIHPLKNIKHQTSKTFRDPATIFATNTLQFLQAKKINKGKSQMPRGGNHPKTYPKDFKQSEIVSSSNLSTTFNLVYNAPKYFIQNSTQFYFSKKLQNYFKK
jgi:hypothetical protein